MFTFGAKPNPRIAIAPGEIRVEKAAPVKKPTPLPSSIASRAAKKLRDTVRAPTSKKTKSRPATPDRLDPATARKRKAQRQISPAQLFSSDDSDDEDGGASPLSDNSFAEKKQRLTPLLDPERQFRVQRSFTAADSGILIHAADVADENEFAISFELQYPAATQREKFKTFFEEKEVNKVKIKFLRPIDEIIKVANCVCDMYLTDEQKPPFKALEPNPGFIRKLERAGKLLEQDPFNTEKQQAYQEAVTAYNNTLESLMRDGALIHSFDQVTLQTVSHCILSQTYDRAVSSQIKKASKAKYKDDKENTYGELLPKFITKVISETELKSDQVFVDLGSGVGNVVLQAALEAGCESWGCEMMEPVCKLAEAQQKEFDVRCRLWGIRPGSVHLERGDFRENDPIKKAMRRADVILVNNEVFGSDLNQSLIQMFLDVKDGCKIVSLKSFVPSGHKMTARNAENPINLLRNEQKYYSEDFVSWKHEAGSYFIATKDSSRLKNFR